jgi:membrane-bound ClpP family serine protease
MDEFDLDLIGTVGRITDPISADRSGEVILPVRGGSEAYEACADQPIAKNTKVVVIDCLSGRTVTVTPIA